MHEKTASSHPNAPLTPVSPDAPPDAPLRLIVFLEQPVHRSTSFDLPSASSTSTARELVVGRTDDCDLVIEHTSVSRKHAAIGIAGNAITIRDLGSQNGTKVGGRKLGIDEVVNVEPGVILEIGRAVVVLEPRDVMARVGEPAAESPIPPLPDLIVTGEGAMRLVYWFLAHVAATTTNILLVGERGVGKETVAESIHNWSERRGRPLVRLDCTTVAGAVSLDAARGNMLLLQDVHELDVAGQAALAKALEGADVRVVATSHKSLDGMVRAGTFDAALHRTLAGISIAIPTLRARSVEIPELAAAFVERACREAGRSPAPALSPEAVIALRRQTWPGNVGELEEVIDRAIGLAHGAVIEPSHLLDPAEAARNAQPASSLTDEISVLEKKRILDTLEHCGGNQSEASRVLGIPRRTLVRRLSEWGLTKRRSTSG